MSPTDPIFRSLKLGKNELKHRIIMAPLTRFRAEDSTHIPGPYAKEYYTQRASTPGTLLITEATYVSPRASGYPNIPGIWSEGQVPGWKEITDAVHEKGSFIFVQMAALGRVANPAYLKKMGGYKLGSSGAVALDEEHEVPTELSVEEIGLLVEDFADAARNAMAAGFDGVEIHGANGYLIDQFW